MQYINPKVEAYVSKKLKLYSESNFFKLYQGIDIPCFSNYSCGKERVATEIKTLGKDQRFVEVQEFFSKDQKGFSAMPHVKILFEEEISTGFC